MFGSKGQLGSQLAMLLNKNYNLIEIIVSSPIIDSLNFVSLSVELSSIRLFDSTLNIEKAKKLIDFDF